MKKWTGGSVILILTILLLIRYSLLPSSSPSSSSSSLFRSRRIHRHHLRFHSLPGLTDLFAPNYTQHNASSKLIWPHMLPVLSRPNPLPATADGVREASIAWRDLAADIELESNVEKGASLELEKRGCPFSVNGTESFLEIPCGLVEDSAVTVVGVPVGRNGSGGFWIELVGGGDGDEVPVVLRVNVSFGGDEVAMSQSSRMKGRGWGEWEPCPSQRQSVNDSNFKGNFLVENNIEIQFKLQDATLFRIPLVFLELQ